ncbi:MAG: DUF4199 domain-containing protein [Bacteroidota bacterium]
MENQAQTLRFGLYIYLGIALLFLLMKLFGLEHIGFLRLINIVIVIHFTNRLARIHNMRVFENDYTRALGSLFFANAIAVVLSVISFAVYVTLFDPDFIQNFKGGLLLHKNISLGNACIALLFEGMASNVIISFATMQYWKSETKLSRPRMNKKVEKAK